MVVAFTILKINKRCSPLNTSCRVNIKVCRIETLFAACPHPLLSSTMQRSLVSRVFSSLWASSSSAVERISLNNPTALHVPGTVSSLASSPLASVFTRGAKTWGDVNWSKARHGPHARRSLRQVRHSFFQFTQRRLFFLFLKPPQYSFTINPFAPTVGPEPQDAAGAV